MNQRRTSRERIAICLALASAALTLSACGSPASDLAFKAPAHWTASPGFFGRMQMWMKLGSDKNHGSVLILVKDPRNMNDFSYNSGMRSTPLQDMKTDTIAICGNEKAQHMTATGQRSGSTGTERFEAVLARVGNSKYLAMYIRPSGQAADPAAEAAIRSLCPLRP